MGGGEPYVCACPFGKTGMYCDETDYGECILILQCSCSSSYIIEYKGSYTSGHFI